MTAPDTVLARLEMSMLRGGSAPMWKEACTGQGASRNSHAAVCLLIHQHADYRAETLPSCQELLELDQKGGVAGRMGRA
jgi:hypothetical protein